MESKHIFMEPVQVQRASRFNHLCRSSEMLGGTLLSLHNLYYFHQLMARIREAIRSGGMSALRAELELQAEQRIRPGDLP